MSSQPIEYDSCGRMRYHPDYHFNHGKAYTVKDLVYICLNDQRGKRKELSLAVGRTEATIAEMLCKFKKDGRFEYYRNLKI